MLVRNMGVATQFNVYDQSKVREEILNGGGREIGFPALDQHVYQSVDRASLQFGTFAESQAGNFSYTERRYTKTWLRECFVALDEVSNLLR
ncbi:MAG: hypothetical protein H7039_03035 [Bryobacteraceae bacterium]|nr:hypothetical protein [Bryobacteraceae bacterium]